MNCINKVNDRKYYHGFDYLRALLSIAVVGLHCGMFTSLEKTNPILFYIVRNHYEFLAVPTFMLISVFLYIRHVNRREYFPNRLKSLLIMYVFWRTVEFFLRGPKIESLKQLFAMVLGSYSATYFILDLCFVIIFTEFLLRKDLNNGQLLMWFIASMLLIPVTFQIIFKAGLYIGYANPFNFLPFALCAIWIAKINTDKFHFQFVYILIILAVFLGIVEFIMEHKSIGIGPYRRPYGCIIYFSYDRLSIMFQSTAIIYIFCFLKTVPKFIKLLSKLSLGIYLTHYLSYIQLRKLI